MKVAPRQTGFTGVLFVGLLSLCGAAFGQVLPSSSVLISAQDDKGTPVSKATVTLALDPPRKSEVAANGQVRFPDVPQGSALVTIEAPGFNSLVTSVVVEASEKAVEAVLTATSAHSDSITVSDTAASALEEGVSPSGSAESGRRQKPS